MRLKKSELKDFLDEKADLYTRPSFIEDESDSLILQMTSSSLTEFIVPFSAEPEHTFIIFGFSDLKTLSISS